MTIILFLLPIMILIAVAIKIDSKGSIIFCQNRIGKDKKIFVMYKFRTMASDAPGDVATDLFYNPSDYISKLGAFLRRYSLDELPQIFNILKGDMSFIGPRPALYNQYDLIEMREVLGINKIRPGLTGLAQINGRDNLSLQEKVNFDYEYLKKISLRADVKIFFATFRKVLGCENVSH